MANSQLPGIKYINKSDLGKLNAHIIAESTSVVFQNVSKFVTHHIRNRFHTQL